jgi:hypothetical protein
MAFAKKDPISDVIATFEGSRNYVRTVRLGPATGMKQTRSAQDTLVMVYFMKSALKGSTSRDLPSSGLRVADFFIEHFKRRFFLFFNVMFRLFYIFFTYRREVRIEDTPTFPIE